MKTKLALEEPKRLVHRNFKSFNDEYFEEELSSKLDVNDEDYAAFEDNVFKMLLINMYLKRKAFLRVFTNHMYPRL